MTRRKNSPKAMNISHSCPTSGIEELQAVARVLESGHHARGAVCTEFEQALARTVGLRHAHAVSSGTAALTLALMALGAGEGREVLVPSLACAALLNAVRFTGAKPVLYDCGYELVEAKAIKRLVTRKTAAAVVVAPPHGFDGLGKCDVGVPVVLDRCQQLAPVEGKRKPAAAAVCEVFSFYATKCISTGTGGAIASNDAGLIARIVDFNTPDKRADADIRRFNFQFDDLRAAMGLAQLSKLKRFVNARRRHACEYAKSLGDRLPAGGMVFRYLHDCSSEGACDALAKRLAKAGVEAKRPVFKPLHRYLGMKDTAFPFAADAWGRMLSLPLYPVLTDEMRERVLGICRQNRTKGG